MLWAVESLVALTERGLLPDFVLRQGIRALLRQRLVSLPLRDHERSSKYLADFITDMASSAIALVPEKANEQHYEVPAEFFERVLGNRLKYSACYWPAGVDHLDAAENAALRATCGRAELADGQKILELGCGWGSLTLWIAQHYPSSTITAVSNSRTQREFILDRAARAGCRNINVMTSDMNDFRIDDSFDRVVSVEMFEHMRNWQALFERVASWLRPQGRFFMHVFCHQSLPYYFEVEDESDWMSRHFFSGGMMPSYDLPFQVGGPLEMIRRWEWSGIHYEKTANAWLANMDRQKGVLWPILEAAYGIEQAARWWVRWRLFFMACAELFGYRDGEEWHVGHYLFRSQQNQQMRISP